jgi:hypothetical protein
VKNPQANAFIEQSHQVIANALRTMELDKHTIDDSSFASICSNVAYGMHATYHKELQTTTPPPPLVIYGRDMIINATYIANWKAITARRATSYRNNNEC